MEAPTLVFCRGGNRRMTEISLAAGYRYGAQLPDTIYYPPWFVDQNWRAPDRARYMRALAEHRPALATVLDWERDDQLPEVLDWAEEASQHAGRVVIIPKVQGGIERLPRRVGGADVVLGYSVPTRYGGTPLPAWEFAGWPIHLLGGSPQAQMHTWQHLTGVAEVVSADGSGTATAAMHGVYWRAGGWVTRDPDLPKGTDLPYRAFERSCREVVAAWRILAG